MAGLHRNNPTTKEGKYCVTRRDGTVPDWPFFVVAASDPAAPAALAAYADAAAGAGMDPAYVADVRALAAEFAEWRKANRTGDPDAPGHRTDDPATIEKMSRGKGA